MWENVQPKYFSLSNSSQAKCRLQSISTEKELTHRRRNSPPKVRNQGRVVQVSQSFSCNGRTVPISPTQLHCCSHHSPYQMTLCLDKGWSQPKWGSEDRLIPQPIFKTLPQTQVSRIKSSVSPNVIQISTKYPWLNSPLTLKKIVISGLLGENLTSDLPKYHVDYNVFILFSSHVIKKIELKLSLVTKGRIMLMPLVWLMILIMLVSREHSELKKIFC